MDEDLVAPPSEFSVYAQEEIDTRFGQRCALCMDHPAKVHYCRILDSEPGSDLHTTGTAFNLISNNFSRSNSNNGVLLCPTCHLSYLASFEAVPALLSFIPCPEILRYLMSRLVSRDFRDVDTILNELAFSPPTTNEAVMARPFIDMYTILPSPEFRRRTIPLRRATEYLPPKLILDATSRSLIDASDVVSPGTNLYRVFDAATIPLTAAPQELGSLHLSPSNLLGVHHDGSRLYWKLPGCSAGAFLTTVFTQVALDTEPVNLDLAIYFRHCLIHYAPLPSIPKGGGSHQEDST
ncbi:hypothetical protein BDZ89DRAFT_1147913 [Hymenopellis radicata]|nr:hypothetical protein BDZ89DRAFT_1147913 [Hymenopellis radicata]